MIPREVIRCTKCKLVMFRGMRTKCPRCLTALRAEFKPVAIRVLVHHPAPPALSTVGQRAKAIRTRCGASMQDIANRMKCQRSYLSKVENDRLTPNWAQLARLAIALGCKEADLVPQRLPKHANGAEDDVVLFMAELYRHCGMLTSDQWVAVRRESRRMAMRKRSCLVIENGVAGKESCA